MEDATPSYGLWGLVILTSAVFIIFAFSFFKPATRRNWILFSAFSAFLVALFVEMYGFPRTIYVLSGWLQSHYPGVNWVSHDSGHMLEMMFGWRSNPHFSLFHILSFILIGGGFILIYSAWHKLFNAQKAKKLATAGPHSYVRHPQYVGFVLVLLGFLAQWPTILTLLMFPVLVVMYVRLAIVEEREVRAEFGVGYELYAKYVPRFFPKWSRITGRFAFQPRDTMGSLKILR